MFPNMPFFISIDAKVRFPTSLNVLGFFQKVTTPELMLQHLLFTISSRWFEGRRYLQRKLPGQGLISDKPTPPRHKVRVLSIQLSWKIVDSRKRKGDSRKRKGLRRSGGCQFLESKYTCHEGSPCWAKKSSRKKKRFQNSKFRPPLTKRNYPLCSLRTAVPCRFCASGLPKTCWTAGRPTLDS